MAEAATTIVHIDSDIEGVQSSQDLPINIGIFYHDKATELIVPTSHDIDMVASIFKVW